MLVILGSAVPGPSIPDPHPCGQGEKRGTESHHSMSRAWDQHPAASRDQQHSTWAAPATSPALAHRAQPPHAAPSTSQPHHKPFYCCSGPSRPSLYTRQAPKDLSTSSTRAARMGEGLGRVERKRVRGWICFLSPRHGPVGVCCWQPSFCSRAGNPEQGRAVQGAAPQHKAAQPRRERGEKEFAASPQRQFQEQLHVLDKGFESEQSPP